MSRPDWLAAARADARARGLDIVQPLLDNLSAAVDVLRSEPLVEVARLHPPAASVPLPAEMPATAAPRADGLLACAARVAAGTTTAERLTEDCLAQVSAQQESLRAFITVTADEALAAARQADRDIAAGRRLGPLHGLPLSLKDLMDQKGWPTTAASKVRASHRASEDAPLTARLRAAGAVFVGKTNLHEFAFGTTSEDTAYGAVHHPVDSRRSPGGSSGGSAVSVATGMALGSVGTDTGGSIRIPAAACGIVGLKPEWGELTDEGVVPLARQFDHLGPMTRTVADAWLMYDVLRGAGPGTGFTPRTIDLRQLTLGVPEGFLFERLDEEVERSVRTAIERLQRAGTRTQATSLPHAAQTPSVYLAIQLADASAYHLSTLEATPELYTPPVRARLELGRYVMAEDYSRAQALRARLRHGVDHALASVHALVLPALAIPAPPIGAATVPVRGGQDPVRAAMLRCTQLFNMTGHPAISLPCGVTREGLPVGLQLVGRRGGTAALLACAMAVEAELGRQR
jgi:aspartyl-tRNA(Asn)/glutamyl-tRNA(Gln) amidotransferase subunit A